MLSLSLVQTLILPVLQSLFRTLFFLISFFVRKANFYCVCHFLLTFTKMPFRRVCFFLFSASARRGSQ